MAKIGFNTADAPAPDNDYSPIPAGEYPMRVVGSEIKATATGGQMLVLEMDITDGPSAGRKHWERLNLVNSNPQAVEIAQRSLAQLCLAVGKVAVEDSDELHMLPFVGKIKVTPAKGDYGPGNAIAAYKPAAGGQAAAKPASTGSTTAQASTGGSKPNATKDPESGFWYDDAGNKIPVFKLSNYNKIEG